MSLSALMLICLLTACGSKLPTAEQVAAKLDTKQSLTEADYTTMIDYCGEYARKAQGYYDQINAQPNDSTSAAIRASSQLADLYASYGYLDQFRNTLAQTELSQLGTDNEKKVNEYAKYQGFPLPVGEAGDLQNPQVVGMIEEMPDSDTTGVISQGDGEAVDLNIK